MLRHRSNLSLELSSESQLEVSSGQLESLDLLSEASNNSIEVPPISSSSSFFKEEEDSSLDVSTSLTISTSSLEPETSDEFGKALTPSNTENFRRLAVRRRHSLQQKDEEGSCRSTMAATADEALFEPSTKFLKPDSPGEAWNGYYRFNYISFKIILQKIFKELKQCCCRIYG